MSDAPAISVRGLTKEYRLGEQKGRTALSEVLANPFRRNGVRRGEWFRALDEVSFDVSPGMALGIIGSNGAGKSTLLKVLSRITKPTAGEVILRGRVGSLLEVGTGFHPELTGRENVFMNGAILGMRKAEIARKFDEIVAFAEVERFIDTPVKRYSSGMYVRLAFAVAAHLEPEILLVDEVLAVGDVAFQKRCLDKMGEVIGDGRTVVFVSHNTAAVRQLTARAILLASGRVEFSGGTEGAIERYLSVADVAIVDVDLDEVPRLESSFGEAARLLRARLVGDHSGSYDYEQRPAVEVTYVLRHRVPAIRLAYTIHRFDGSPVGTAWSPDVPAPLPGTVVRQVLTLEGPRIAPGTYTLALGLGHGDEWTGPTEFDLVMDTVHFTINEPLTVGGMSMPWYRGWGVVRLPDPSILESCRIDKPGP